VRRRNPVGNCEAELARELAVQIDCRWSSWCRPVDVEAGQVDGRERERERKRERASERERESRARDKEIIAEKFLHR